MIEKFCDWPVEHEMMFPPRVRDFVPEGHVARFVRELINEEQNLRDIRCEEQGNEVDIG